MANQLERLTAGIIVQLQHSELNKRYQALQDKQDACQALTIRLDFFKALPPDMKAAQELFRQTQTKLNDIHCEFDMAVSNAWFQPFANYDLPFALANKSNFDRTNDTEQMPVYSLLLL